MSWKIFYAKLISIRLTTQKTHCIKENQQKRIRTWVQVVLWWTSFSVDRYAYHFVDADLD